MENIDTRFYDERLQLLKQATLINYSDDVSFQEDESKNLELLDVLLEHLYLGDLDFCFQSKTLLGVDLEEKEEIYKLVRKYVSLCFYGGKSDYWLDSIEGITLGGDNADFICMKILENYDFILGLARDGGEDVLKLVSSFKENEKFQDCAVIDTLRNYFNNDDLLSDILVDMADDSDCYQDYTPSQLAIMCTFPEGVLFNKNSNGEVQRIPANDLLDEVRKYLTYDMEDYRIEEVLKAVGNREFQDIIFEIHYNSLYDNSKKYSI